MKENNTDARKAAEEILDKHNLLKTDRCGDNFLDVDAAIDAMLEFAQSYPATLDEVSDEEIKEAAEQSYNNTSVWLGGYFTPFQSGVRWRESLSEQPEAKPTESEQVEKLREALEKILNSKEPISMDQSMKWEEITRSVCKEALNSLKQ